MDRPIPGSPPIPGALRCKNCGRLVEGVSYNDQAIAPRRRGRGERPLREHIFGKLQLEKVQKAIELRNSLIIDLKERIIYLYGEKERWKELSQRKRK
jgi:hypothetical protein